jgi:hypothetical protein
MLSFRIRLLNTISLACLIIFFFSQAGYAQTADQIVARHIQALGGKDRLQSINSLYMDGKAVMGDGAELTIKVWKVYDRLYRQETQSASDKMVVIVTPARGWVAESRKGGEFQNLPDIQLKTLQPEIDPAGALADYAAKGCRVDLAGKDSVGGHECYLIKVACPGGQAVTYSIDTKTYYILREVRKGICIMGGIDSVGVGRAGAAGASRGRGAIKSTGGDPQVVIEYSDYKTTPEGYVFPYTLTAGTAGARVTVQNIVVNQNIDAAALSRPK